MGFVKTNIFIVKTVEIIILCQTKELVSNNTIILSSDEIENENDVTSVIDKINNCNIDVIIGTQIMTKGYHFPRLTTIIVLDIDSMAVDGDFRSYEKMFQMLY